MITRLYVAWASYGLLLFATVASIWGCDDYEPTDTVERLPDTSSRTACLDRPTTSCAPHSGRFSLAVLPDTQAASHLRPEAFRAQTRWIRENHRQLDIRYVLHEGDISDRTDYASVPAESKAAEWARIRTIFDELDGGGPPYALALGNHDYDLLTCQYRDAPRFDRTFPLAQVRAWPTFRESFPEGSLHNSVHIFSAGGLEWMVLALEYAPRQITLDWANAVVERYPQHNVIVLTHAYLGPDGAHLNHVLDLQSPRTFVDDYCPDQFGDGDVLWHGLVKRHANILMVLSGHAFESGECHFDGGAARNVRFGEAGNRVYEMLTNYQDVEWQFTHGYGCGGVGYLRLLEVDVDARTLGVRTFSPYCQDAEWESCPAQLEGDAHTFTFHDVELVGAGVTPEPLAR